jgi:hypothetical protein
MIRVRADELPPGRLRDAVARASGENAARASSVVRRRARGANRNRYTCATCGTTFSAWAPAERHADTHGGARLALDLQAVR